MKLLSSLAVGALAFTSLAQSADWPQWLGPNRDSVWPEEGILGAIPPEGLKVKWRKPVGLGYSGPAVVDGHVYVTDYEKAGGKLANNPGNRDKLEGRERILCFEAATGKLVWERAYDQLYSLSYASGPRCSPTVADGKVYAL
ncbi:MAG: PQQ-binding-like beta-propeller repeat protein, partial [Verrucomicrobiota bacterium]